MSSATQVHVIGATRVIIGLSVIVKIGQMDRQSQLQFKHLSGGSLEIVEPGTDGWGKGYLAGTAEVFSSVTALGPACYYLAATNATVVVQVLVGRTAGATII